VHGTGCVYSAAIAALLAKGSDVLEAVREAKDLVTEAIRRAVPVGGGMRVM
jgi:hydroxymethylpyrimidine/phosphomethylpyrimidine kinase